MPTSARRVILEEFLAARTWVLLVVALAFLLTGTVLEIETFKDQAPQPTSTHWYASLKSYAAICKEFGFATFIAFVVSLAIERTSRHRQEEEFKQYQKEIATNVLYAVMRKEFPASIWREIDETILSVDFVRTRFHATYTFSNILDASGIPLKDHIRVDNEILYLLKNIAEGERRTKAGVRFRLPDDARVTDKGDLQYIKIDEVEVDAVRSVEGMYSVNETPLILQPGQEMAVAIRYHMVKRRSDYEVWTSAYPTVDARVDIISNIDGLTFSAEALQRYPVKALRTDDSGRYQYWEFQRPILPYQGIMIFWYEGPRNQVASSSRPMPPDKSEAAQ
jgi:hypothetical protein